MCRRSESGGTTAPDATCVCAGSERITDISVAKSGSDTTCVSTRSERHGFMMDHEVLNRHNLRVRRKQEKFAYAYIMTQLAYVGSERMANLVSYSRET